MGEPEQDAPRLSSEIVAYLRAVAEGRRDIPAWRAFLDEHRVAFEQALSRVRYLRLKFSPTDTLPPLLDAYGITYEGAPLLRRLRLADLGWEPVLPDTAARVAYREGRLKDGDRAFARLARRLAKKDDCGQAFAELTATDVLLDLGFEDEALGALLAVASVPRSCEPRGGDTHLDWGIDLARTQLTEIAQRVLGAPCVGTPEALVRAIRSRSPKTSLRSE